MTEAPESVVLANTADAGWVVWQSGGGVPFVRASLVRDLLATLPACDDHPDRPATRQHECGYSWFCDECGLRGGDEPDVDELHYAPALRRLLALMARATDRPMLTPMPRPEDEPCVRCRHTRSRHIDRASLPEAIEPCDEDRCSCAEFISAVDHDRARHWWVTNRGHVSTVDDMSLLALAQEFARVRGEERGRAP